MKYYIAYNLYRQAGGMTGWLYSCLASALNTPKIIVFNNHLIHVSYLIFTLINV